MAEKTVSWISSGYIPDDEISGPSNYERGHKLYGKKHWADFFAGRQLLALGTAAEQFGRIRMVIDAKTDSDRATAIKTYLAMAFDKAISHNSNACWWDGSRFKVVNIFSKHGFAMKWSFAEYDAARSLLPWSVEQIADAYAGIAQLANTSPTLWDDIAAPPIERLSVTQGSAASLAALKRHSVHHICVDPPYYNNVMYAELSDFYIRGVDLYISTFGPVLSIISENWPVLTSETDSKSGDPVPLKPGEALDLARQEVVNLRKKGLLLGRTVEFDPVTDWYRMAWDAFTAQEFPADEARKLALALGLDLEQDLLRNKRLVTKKSASVVLNLPAARRKKGMVDEEAESFPHLIDALHTAMMIYDEEGSKACQVFVDRQGLQTDTRTKALVQAVMQAIPTTRDKQGKFLRPEMTTLDALRMLFWEDLPAPKEEEPPKLDRQQMLAGFDEEGGEGEETDEEEDQGEEE